MTNNNGDCVASNNGVLAAALQGSRRPVQFPQKLVVVSSGVPHPGHVSPNKFLCIPIMTDYLFGILIF